MNSFVLCLADVPIRVSCFYDTTGTYCRDYLCDLEPQYEITITEEDIAYEKQLDTLRASDQYLETLAVFRKAAKILIHEDVMVFHSSVIEVDGCAYVFSGSSGTGKSTHVKLWREYLKDRDVHMINDDKPLMKISGEIKIYGTPWMGKYRIGENRNAPIKAICFLDQGTENRIQRLNKDDALTCLYKQTYRVNDREMLCHTLELLHDVARLIPVYHMDCTISYEAVRLAYEKMKGEEE